MAETLCSLKTKGSGGTAGVVSLLDYGQTVASASAITHTCDYSSYTGKAIVIIGTSYDSVIYEVNLDNNTYTKVAEYGNYQGRTSLSCVNKIVTLTLNNVGLGVYAFLI